VIMYADKITDSMKRTIDETNRRRLKQLKFNEDNNITPQQIIKERMSMMGTLKSHAHSKGFYTEPEEIHVAADPVVKYMDENALKKAIENTRKSMEKAARQLDFIQAARFRDEMFELEKLLKKKM